MYKVRCVKSTYLCSPYKHLLFVGFRKSLCILKLPDRKQTDRIQCGISSSLAYSNTRKPPISTRKTLYIFKWNIDLKGPPNPLFWHFTSWKQFISFQENWNNLLFVRCKSQSLYKEVQCYCKQKWFTPP